MRSGKKRTTKKLRGTLRGNLRAMYEKGRGVKRKDIKDEHNRTPYIHSDETYKTYLKQVNRFCDYCYEHNYKKLTEDIDFIVEDYINDMQKRGLTPHSQRTALCAISKALNRPTTSFEYIDIPKRQSVNYTRSRGIKERDKHFSEKNHEDLVTLCRCLGPRKEKELEQIRASDFYEKDGKLYCHIKGKGGKFREAPLYFENDHERQIVRKLLIKNPQGRLFPPSKVPVSADIHNYRAEYAARVYNANARDTRTLPRSECYHKQTGEVYDKKALGIASKAIGHGYKRYYDMVHSYGRYCKQF